MKTNSIFFSETDGSAERQKIGSCFLLCYWSYSCYQISDPVLPRVSSWGTKVGCHLSLHDLSTVPPHRHHFDLQTLSELKERSQEKANEVEMLREHRGTVFCYFKAVLAGFKKALHVFLFFLWQGHIFFLLQPACVLFVYHTKGVSGLVLTRLFIFLPLQEADSWEIIEGLKIGQSNVQRPDKHEGFMLKKRKWPLKGWHKVRSTGQARHKRFLFYKKCTVRLIHYQNCAEY